jgi:predicted Rossmann fold nucleotide-binding protein DprA/Smf involved in DNA uptake
MLAHGVGDAFAHRFSEFVLRHGMDGLENLSVGKLCSILGLKDEIAYRIISSCEEAKALSHRLKEFGISWVSLLDDEYPDRFRNILKKEAPPILFFRGNLGLCKEHSVGFCGSRSASENGLLVTEKCCLQLVEQDVVVVSGYAQGVDIVSHRTALQGGGKTIIILAEGIFHFREKREIYGLLHSENHLILSQFPPGLTWSGRNAMRRNSTIISLSDAMILIESGKTGGTYAAGSECLHRKVPLFVIDFKSPPGPTAEANPEFIRRGGMPIRGTKTMEPNLNHLFDKVNGCAKPQLNDLFRYG